MATPFDPWMPDLGDVMPQVPQAVTGFLNDPQGRAALLSAGLALMQPPSFGDNPASQIGRAIGAAGQSATANEATEMKGQELESKQDLRSSQAMAAEARAGAATARAEIAGARAGNAADRLAFQRERLEAMNQRHTLGQRVRLSNMYQQYVKDVAKRNSDPLKTGTLEPVLPMQDWISQNPMLKNLGLMPSTGTAEPDEEVPAVSAPTTSGGVVQAPREASQRTAGTVYQTPKGPLKWTGTGWVSP